MLIEPVKLICAKCNKPVDSFEEVRFATFTRYIARCHGDEQQVQIGLLQLARADGVSLGRAFDTPQLAQDL